MAFLKAKCCLRILYNAQNHLLLSLSSSLSLLHSSSALSQPCSLSSGHLSPTIPHVLLLTISSTIRSLLTKLASASVLASFGKYLALYGSSLSSTTLSRARSLSTARNRESGSSGSGEVATDAQYVRISERICQAGKSRWEVKVEQAEGSI